MRIELRGTAGPRGWPEPGCRCASCSRMRASGRRWEPTRVLVDGVPLDRCARRAVPGGFEVSGRDGGRLLFAAGPGARPEPAAHPADPAADPGAPETRGAHREPYEAVLLDLIGSPEHLGRLRRAGVVTPATSVRAVHNDHRISSPAELVRRLEWWTAAPRTPWRTLVLGGARSGKSEEAELRVAAHPEVTYVATGLTTGTAAEDPHWLERIAAHRGRRPAHWRTVETTDVAEVLRTASGTLLLDGLGTWLAAVMDRRGAWEDPGAVDEEVGELVAAWRDTGAHVVAVGDEVGLSVIPETAAGRAFRDTLGRLNQRLAAESEEAVLVVAGRTVTLP